MSAPQVERLDMNEAIDNANTSADEGNQHKAENQLIVSNCTDELTDPSDGRRDPATNIGQHSRNGISGTSLKNHSFTKLLNIHQPGDKADSCKREEEADKVTDRLSHKKVRELRNEPYAKFPYALHNRAPPALKIQKRTTNSRKREASQLESYSRCCVT